MNAEEKITANSGSRERLFDAQIEHPRLQRVNYDNGILARALVQGDVSLMTRHTRRDALTATAAAFAGGAGCLSESGTSDEGPTTHPSSDTAVNGGAAMTDDETTEYEPLSMTVWDEVPMRLVGGPVKNEWDEARAVELAVSARLVVVMMEFTNHAAGPDDAPAVGSRLGVRVGDTPRPSVTDVEVVPVGGDGGDLREISIWNVVPDKKKHGHPLDERMGGWSDIRPDETATGWFASTVPSTAQTDEIHPAMGSGDSRNELPVRWTGGYDVSEGYND